MNDPKTLPGIYAQGEVMHGERIPVVLSLTNSQRVTMVERANPSNVLFDVAASDIVRVEPSPYGLTIVTAAHRYYAITIQLEDALNATVSPYFFGLALVNRRKTGTKQWVNALKSLGVSVSARGYVRFYSRLIGFYLLAVAAIVALLFAIF